MIFIASIDLHAGVCVRELKTINPLILLTP